MSQRKINVSEADYQYLMQFDDVASVALKLLIGDHKRLDSLFANAPTVNVTVNMAPSGTGGAMAATSSAADDDELIANLNSIDDQGIW